MHFVLVDLEVANRIYAEVNADKAMAAKLNKTALPNLKKAIDAQTEEPRPNSTTNDLMPSAYNLPCGKSMVKSCISQSLIQGAKVDVAKEMCISLPEALMLIEIMPYSPLFDGSRLKLGPTEVN